MQWMRDLVLLPGWCSSTLQAQLAWPVRLLSCRVMRFRAAWFAYPCACSEANDVSQKYAEAVMGSLCSSHSYSQHQPPEGVCWRAPGVSPPNGRKYRVFGAAL